LWLDVKSTVHNQDDLSETFIMTSRFDLSVGQTRRAKFEKLVTTAHDPEILKCPFVDSFRLTVPLS